MTRPSGVKKAPFAKMILRSCRNSSQNRASLNRYLKRETIDPNLAETMKKLAKDKMYRAISDVSYAQGDYAKEMEHDTLKAEAEVHLG